MMLVVLLFRPAALMKGAVIAAISMAAIGVQAQCYTVYGRTGAVVHESVDPPVDLSLQLHQSVPGRFGPGATMAFTLAGVDSCGHSGSGPTRGYLAGASNVRPTVNASTLTGMPAAVLPTRSPAR